MGGATIIPRSLNPLVPRRYFIHGEVWQPPVVLLRKLGLSYFMALLPDILHIFAARRRADRLPARAVRAQTP
jgi:hypothetical protein